MNRIPLSGGEIYIRRENKKHNASAHTRKLNRLGLFFKTVGVTLSMLLVIFVVNGIVVAGQNVFKPQTANTITDETTPPTTPGIRQFLPQTQNEPVDTVTLAQTAPPPQTFNFNQPTLNQPITTPTLDVGGLINQINQANASIAQNMQACVQLTQQAQAQVAQMRATEQQMQEALNQINRQNLSLNPNDPNTPALRAQLQAQRDQIFFQRSQVLSAISQAKSQFYRSKADCQNSVYRQQNAKRNLENQLNNAFQRSITINLF